MMPSEMEPRKQTQKQEAVDAQWVNVESINVNSSPVLAHAAPPQEGRVGRSSHKRRRRGIQEKIEAQIALDDELWSYLTMGLIILGVLLFFLSAILVATSGITIATATGGSGLIIDASTILVLRQRKEARIRADRLLWSHYAEKLIDKTQGEPRLRLKEVYIEQIPPPELPPPRTHQEREGETGNKNSGSNVAKFD